MELNKDLYKCLELDKNATDEEIKKSYKKLAVKYHPDKNKGDKTCEEKFKEISNAYHILKDKNTKEQYDYQSPYGKNYNPNRNPFGGFGNFGGEHDINDILRNFGFNFGFNFGGNAKQEQFRENLDIYLDVNVTFNDVYCNNLVDVKYKHYISCDVCSGTGFNPNSESFMCEVCSGKGKDLYGFICEHCQGSGKIHTGTCTKCNGEKVIIKEENFQVNNIFQLDKDFQTRKSGFGHQSKYYRNKRGDLILRFRFHNNTNFVKSNRGLEYKLDLHYEYAINGTDVILILPDNKKYELKIPAKTKDGDVLRMQNMGVFTFDGKTRTDLYITINIIIDYDKLNI